MTLVTVATYRRITGDETGLEQLVSARIEDATDHLVERLERPLAEAERTEMMWADRAGWIWPKATPVLVADGYFIEGHGLRGGAAFSAWQVGDWVQVTYTGGYVERSANPTATNRLPVCIERDIALAARALADAPVAEPVTAGAKSVAVGDVSITYGADGAPGVGEMLERVWSSQTLRYQWRRAW